MVPARNSCLCHSFPRSDARPSLLPSLSCPALLVLAGWPGNEFLFLEKTLQKLSAPTFLVEAQGGVEHRRPEGSALSSKPSLMKKLEGIYFYC